MKRKVIVTCAVTGGAVVNPKHPNFPITPSQIADAVYEAASAGAAIVHIHVRNPETGETSRDPALFREVVDRIRQAGVNIVINLTCGHGAFFLPNPENEGHALPASDVVSAQVRTTHLADCLPEIASLDITTMNWETPAIEYVYLNTPRTLRKMAAIYRDLGVKPELEVFHPGDILLGNRLVEEGLVDGPAIYQFVLGVKWASPATPETMIYMRDLIAGEAHWGAFGLGPMQFPMAAQSMILGGNVRVGLEDNLYLDRGVFATNGQLVERAVRIIEDLGSDIATPDETREILALRRHAPINGE
ncbi:3-keto-5-aminohexanoate cleavage protein [Sphingorhabdus sp.]|jgi:uncharacterized protein (DUF849 family)|uniref:3-keto-5-aminohexanoate cleavage protein n=1 Tax=Sphingorhabdus sp. TaxID=1902408 RepID=UPI0037CC15A2